MPHAPAHSRIDASYPPAPDVGADAGPAAQRRLTVLAERLSHTLALARALVLGGRTLDLTGVDDGVGMLCAQTLDLPTAQARAMLPVLHGVLGQIDLLMSALPGRPALADNA
jgi:hypothetical protein